MTLATYTVVRCYWELDEDGKTPHVDLIRVPGGDWQLVGQATDFYDRDGLTEFDRIEVLAEGIEPFPINPEETL